MSFVTGKIVSRVDFFLAKRLGEHDFKFVSSDFFLFVKLQYYFFQKNASQTTRASFPIRE